MAKKATIAALPLLLLFSSVFAALSLILLIGGHQVTRGCQQAYIKKEIARAKEEGKPYLPIANRAQRFFTGLGYQLNGVARWTIRKIGALRAGDRGSFPEKGRLLATAMKTAIGAALALALFAVSTPCYLLGSYVGVGRFERVDAATSPSAAGDTPHIVFQNTCGQDPWSIFTGKELPPMERGADGTTRADSILDAILEKNPDLYCGQEFDDLGFSSHMADELSRRGYSSIRDLGCNDPFLNHSGLFIAAKDPAALDSLSFHGFHPDDMTGITHWTRRGIFESTVSLPNGQSLKVINVHLNSGSSPEDHSSRITQLQKYIAPLAQANPRTIVVGDANLDTRALTPEEWEKIGLPANALQGQITCTDRGKYSLNGTPLSEPPEDESIDVILHDSTQVAIQNVSLKPGHSDHSQISFQVIPL